MAKTLLNREPDGTIKIAITLPHASVEKTREEVIVALTKEVNVPGFRKGNAPKHLAAEKLNREYVQEEVLKKLLPPAYMEAVQEHQLRPIMNPKMHLDKLTEGEDWEFTALTCEMPNVTMTDYKPEVKKLTAKGKIIVPGKEAEKPKLEDVVKVLLDHAKVQIPQILVEQETDRLLAQLLDDIKRLGLSLEQYLGTTKRTPDDLRKEYSVRAESDIKLEFVLQKVAEVEKITVSNEEVEEAIQKAKSPQEKQNLEANRYLLAGILRQQKTLDFLMNL